MDGEDDESFVDERVEDLRTNKTWRKEWMKQEGKRVEESDSGEEDDFADEDEDDDNDDEIRRREE